MLRIRMADIKLPTTYRGRKYDIEGERALLRVPVGAKSSR